jgi:hypothetical protein
MQVLLTLFPTIQVIYIKEKLLLLKLNLLYLETIKLLIEIGIKIFMLFLNNCMHPQEPLFPIIFL